MQHDFDDLSSGDSPYGDLSDFKVGEFGLANEMAASLGCKDGPVFAIAVMRYVAGCIRRERERLASVIIHQSSPQEIAAAILDSSLDALVFKWNGPEVRLDAAPKSVEDRAAEQVYRSSQE